jgi:cell division protein FtsL
MINLIILSFITISAFTVIYVKHKNRLINIEIEKIEKKLSNELNEHKKLLDIKAQLIDKKLTDSNIKRILGMEIPDKNKVIYIDLVE